MVSGPRRCLLVECLPYHWEVLPAWVGLLQRLGWDVEVAGPGDAAGHQETLALLQSRCRTHQAGELQNGAVAACPVRWAVIRIRLL